MQEEVTQYRDQVKAIQGMITGRAMASSCPPLLLVYDAVCLAVNKASEDRTEDKK